ncbi:acyl-CoA thioesterase [Bacillus luteolus]|uniref:Acyl-CoA thioesterase n=1 Tax=Litchfieldia luteola TaxID=682179 RepID=A0ABR9QKC9_9BACI|nr:thioesterase family protein [Cytobacillus luteolus]MBE4908965.1 acyl-CoA thioesterase [Cytobacillus luteolus]MBP1941824.1 acyl-CoA thioester hydrolase [Cytobacillus luteolus]
MNHITKIKVRFGETDALGHINNSSYFAYLEDARIGFFESIGCNMSTTSWNFILASTKCDFIGQGYFNQILKITTTVTRIGNKSFQLEHEIFDDQTDRLIARGNAIIVYFDFEEQQSVVIPESLKVELERHLVASS